MFSFWEETFGHTRCRSRCCNNSECDCSSNADAPTQEEEQGKLAELEIVDDETASREVEASSPDATPVHGSRGREGQRSRRKRKRHLHRHKKKEEEGG